MVVHATSTQLMIHNHLGCVIPIKEFGLIKLSRCKEITSKKTMCGRVCNKLCLNVLSGEITSSCGYHLKKIKKKNETYEVFTLIGKNHIKDIPNPSFQVTESYFGPITYVQWLHDHIHDKKIIDKIDSLRYHIDFMTEEAINSGNRMNVINYDGTYDGTIQFMNEYITTLTQSDTMDVGHINEWKKYQRYILKCVKQFKQLQHELNYVEKTREYYKTLYLKYDKCNLRFNHEDECSICLSSVEKNDGGTIKQCGHTFHNECLTKWLIDKKSCPNCRCKILVPMFML